MHVHDDEPIVARGREFGAEHIATSVEARDRDMLWDAALFRRLGDEGFLHIADDAGGAHDTRALLDFLRGFGEGSTDAGLALAIAMHVYACALPIAIFGTQAQRRRYLPALGAGEWTGAFAHGEEVIPGQTLPIRTRATRAGSRWILEGKKTCVANGPHADVFLVSAITDPDRGREGISVFVVEKNARGCSVGRHKDAIGLRTAGFSDVTFERCEVSSDNLLGARGSFTTSVQPWIQRAERAAYMAPWIGIMRGLLERCVEKARTNHVFVKPASQSQQVRARLANMRIEYELCRRLQARAGWLLEHEMPGRDRDIASSRLYMTESLGKFMRDARRFFDLSGDSVLDRLARDADAFMHMNGGPDALRILLGASLLGLG